jgi:hypothetical protein
MQICLLPSIPRPGDVSIFERHGESDAGSDPMDCRETEVNQEPAYMPSLNEVIVINGGRGFERALAVCMLAM